MRKTKMKGKKMLLLTFPVLVILGMLCFYPVKAQEMQDEVMKKNAELIDSIEIVNPQVNIGEDGIILGSFKAKNISNSYHSDLLWKFLIFKGGIVNFEFGADGSNQEIKATRSVLIDYVMSEEKFSLAPGEEKLFNFKYNISKVAAPRDNDYSVKIKVMTSNNIVEFGGWTKPNVELGQTGNPFSILENKMTYNGKEQNNLEGVNVNSGDKINVKMKVNNSSAAALRIKANIKTYERLETQKKVDDSNTRWFDLPASQDSDIEFYLSDNSNLRPESYLSEVRFYDQDENLISSIIDYRWVVMGVSANIVKVTSEKNKYTKGESVNLQVIATGPSDFVSKADLNIEAEFYDIKDKKVAVFFKKENFASSDDAKYFDFSDQKFPVATQLSKAIIRIKNNGQELDSYELKLINPNSIVSEPLKKNANSKILFFLFLLIFLGVLGYVIWKKKISTNIFLIVAVIFSASLFAYVGTSKARDRCSDCQKSETCTNDECDTNWGTYLTNMCGMGCGTTTCYTGWSFLAWPTIRKIDNYNMEYKSYEAIFKCWNALSLDYNFWGQRCNNTTGTYTVTFSDSFISNAGATSRQYGQCQTAGQCNHEFIIILRTTEIIKMHSLTSVRGYCGSNTQTVPTNVSYDNSAACTGTVQGYRIDPSGNACVDGSTCPASTSIQYQVGGGGWAGTANNPYFLYNVPGGLNTVRSWNSSFGLNPPGWTISYSIEGAAYLTGAQATVDVPMGGVRNLWWKYTPNVPPTPVNGACSDPPVHYNCAAGTLGSTAEYPTLWQWWCNGTNGGSNILCTEWKLPPTTLEFSASPNPVDYNTSSTLFWTPVNATWCWATGPGNWNGSKSYTGVNNPEQTENLTMPTTYFLTCGNGGPPITKSVTIGIKPKCIPIDSDPPSATLCPGDDQNLPGTDDIYKIAVDECTSRKCEYKCNPNTFLKDGICIPKQDGKCNAETENRVFCQAPTDHLCETGDPTVPSPSPDGKNWNWICKGNYPGSEDPTCTATRSCAYREVVPN